MAIMDSRTLRTAQIHFIDQPISLIHIPLHSYSRYVQPILQILYPLVTSSGKHPPNGSSSPSSASPWMNRHAFLNLSITPVECSLFCSKALADEYFAPAITESRKTGKSADQVSISREDFLAMSVEGEGLEAGQRVLELTTPLAMAGVSVFFITTYFSDYLLVPSKSRGKVMHALEERGFAFDRRIGSHHRMTSSTSSTASFDPASSHHNQHRHEDSRPRFSTPSPPNSAAAAAAASPPSSIADLQSTTIALLKRRGILPFVHRSVRLLQCAGREDTSNDPELQIGLMKCVAHPPRFLSLTLTATEPASLLLEEDIAARFGGRNNLMGSRDTRLVPILLDLGVLPLEATGIVCGIASKLVSGRDEVNGGTNGQEVNAVEMSYLSTARGAAVLVDEADLDRAVEALRAGENGLDIV